MNQSWQQSQFPSPNQNPQDTPRPIIPLSGSPCPCPGCPGYLQTWIQDDKWRAFCGMCNYQTQPG